MRPALVIALLMLVEGPARAETAEEALAAYTVSVGQAYARETRSQCLARMRSTTSEIIVCGARDRNDRFRLRKSGTVIIEETKILSPVERVLETQKMVQYSKRTVGIGYESVAIPAEQGYARRSYVIVTNLVNGVDPDLE
jgi:hypothetical protein